MAGQHLHVRIRVMVPAIFAGLSVLATAVAVRTMSFCARHDLDPTVPVVVIGGLMAVIAALCAGLAVTTLLRPMAEFVGAAGRHVGEREPRPKGAIIRRQTEVEHFMAVSGRVADVLDQAEARKRFPDIVGESEVLRSVLALVVKIAPTDTSVLIVGESGTGKELIARSLHEQSRRRQGPFVAVNCAGIAEGLIESELFGHEKGAFTGAHARKVGKLEAANGGTVFLDEIGDMPQATQAKVLRALQEREIERVGSHQTIPIDIRFVAATNKDLEAMVREGRFREDLFFRLNGLMVRLPSLRARVSDIPLLARHFASDVNPGLSIMPEAMALLAARPWPGNVRELQNAVVTAAALGGDVIRPQDLPQPVSEPPPEPDAVQPGLSAPPDQALDEQLAGIEKAMIVDALRRSSGVQKTAAGLLGIKERSLWHRIAKYGIDVGAIRDGAGGAT